jgi:glycosyltransferase involved in cell wall biosynthesis
MLAVACLALALAWLYHAVLAFFGVPTLPDVREPASEVEVSTAKGFAQEPETSIPDLTVVVPACNEGESIQATLRSLLGSKGGRLQIVAINDRSTDATGALMDEVAAEAARDRGGNSLEVIHNHELPAGWLGKTHALALGAAKAEAPWLLFTDGDVLFDPVAARLALEFAQTVSADHVVLLLTLDFENSMEAAVFATVCGDAPTRVHETFSGPADSIWCGARSTRNWADSKRCGWRWWKTCGLAGRSSGQASPSVWRSAPISSVSDGFRGRWAL